MELQYWLQLVRPWEEKGAFLLFVKRKEKEIKVNYWASVVFLTVPNKPDWWNPVFRLTQGSLFQVSDDHLKVRVVLIPSSSALWDVVLTYTFDCHFKFIFFTIYLTSGASSRIDFNLNHTFIWINKG